MAINFLFMERISMSLNENENKTFIFLKNTHFLNDGMDNQFQVINDVTDGW